MLDFHIDWAALAVAAVGFFAGYVRIAARTEQNSEDLKSHKITTESDLKEHKEAHTKAIDELKRAHQSAIETFWRKHDESYGEVRREMTDMSKALARIEGRLFNETNK